MNLVTMLKKWIGGIKSKPARTRLNCESLDSRLVPAALALSGFSLQAPQAVRIWDDGSVIHVEGTDQHEQVFINHDPSTDQVRVTVHASSEFEFRYFDPRPTAPAAGALLAQRTFFLGRGPRSLDVKTFGGSDVVRNNTALPMHCEAGGGNDLVYGGTVRDEILGGAGSDYLDGHDGNDVIRGGAGNDALVGGFGSDELYGEADGDNLQGALNRTAVFDQSQGWNEMLGYRSQPLGDGLDYLDGGTGNDSLDGGYDYWDDCLIGGEGDDYFHYYVVRGNLPWERSLHRENVRDFDYYHDWYAPFIKYSSGNADVWLAEHPYYYKKSAV